MADFNFNGYAKNVLEDVIKSSLKTKLDMNRFMTPDYQLVENPGLTKKVHVYTQTGSADVLNRGDGNSHYIDSEYIERTYAVERTQAQTRWYDDDAYSDPSWVDAKIQFVAEAMVNTWNSKAIAEFGKSVQTVDFDGSTTTAGYLFGKFADAVALFKEDENGLFALIDPSLKAYFRKAMASELEYVEAFVRTGYIGSVCGVPVYVTNELAGKDAIVIATKEAVKAFMKQDVRVETDRDPNTKKNSLIADRYAVIALYDNSKLVNIAKAQSTACAITTYTKAAKTIAGTCGTDCFLVHVVDGDGIGYDVTPSNGSWTMSASANLTAGDKINATAYAPFKAAKKATEVTVAS